MYSAKLQHGCNTLQESQVDRLTSHADLPLRFVLLQAASTVAPTASLSATATTEDRSAAARSQLKKKPAADAPAASQPNPAALEVPSLDPDSACRPTNVRHAMRTAAAAAHPEHDPPVQFVEQEDLGDVDISDDLAFAPAAAEISAAAEAEGSDTVQAELSEVAQAEHGTAGKGATDGTSAAAAPAPSTGTQDSDKAAPPEAATDGAPAQTAPDRAAATGRGAGALHAAAEEAGVPAREKSGCTCCCLVLHGVET